MMLFNKTPLIRGKLFNFLYRNYAAKTEPIIVKPLPENLSRLYDRHKDFILYSSVVEDSKLKLGYHRNKIIGNLLKKEETNVQNKRVDIMPLSLAAEFLNENEEENENPIKFKENRRQFIQIQLNDDQGKIELLKKMQRHKNEIDILNPPEDNSWMRDYEAFDDDDSDGSLSKFGTADPNVPVSKVPCYGCGALLQCANSSLPGYLPSELFRGQSDDILKTVTCQRCHFLKTYNTAINMTVSSDEYVKMISSIKDKFALAILMIDLTDFPCSIWPNINEIIGNVRPVFVVGNKIDLLPKDSTNHLNHVKNCLEQAIIESGITQTNIKHVCLISAKTGYGIEELITKLHNVWRYKGDVYLIGCTNVGKSSLFNALLRSDYCKVKASNIIKKATASQWPGTTLRMLKFPILRPSDMRVYQRTQRLLSERAQKIAEEKLRKSQARTTRMSEPATLIGHIGRTFTERTDEDIVDSFSMGSAFQKSILSLNETSKEYVTSKWCYDTPGVIQPQQIINMLTTEELLQTIPAEMIKPQTYLFKPEMSIFLAGLGRLDYISGPDKIRITIYAAKTLPVMIVKTNQADFLYKEFLGTEFLSVPIGDAERLEKWPLLEDLEMDVFGEGTHISTCDILFSSAGWIGVSIPENQKATFRAWTPQRKGIVMRKPSLIPYGVALRGARIRRSLAYKYKNTFVGT